MADPDALRTRRLAAAAKRRLEKKAPTSILDQITAQVNMELVNSRMPVSGAEQRLKAYKPAYGGGDVNYTSHSLANLLYTDQDEAKVNEELVKFKGRVSKETRRDLEKKAGSPEVTALLQKINQAEAVSGKSSKPGPSGIKRLGDLASRGGYAVSNAFLDIGKQAKKEHAKGNKVAGVNPLRTAGAFWRGLSGKDKTSFTDVLAMSGQKNPVVRFVAGVGADIALDPLTYVGVGLVKKGVKAADATIDTAKTVRAATKAPLQISPIVDEVQPAVMRGAKGRMLPLNRVAKELGVSNSVAETILAQVPDVAKGTAAKDILATAAGKTGKAPEEYLKSISKPSLRAVDEALAMEQKAQLVATAARNAADPKKTEFFLKFGTKQVGKTHTMPAILGDTLNTLYSKAGITATVAKAGKAFDESFRAKKILGNSVAKIRGEQIGHSHSLFTELHKDLSRSFGHQVADEATRISAMETLVRGGTDVVGNKNGENIVNIAATRVDQIVNAMEEISENADEIKALWNNSAVTKFKIPDGETLRSAWKSFDEEDIGRFIGEFQATAIRVNAHMGIAKSVRELAAVPIKGLDPASRAALTKNGYREIATDTKVTSGLGPVFKDHLFPEKIAEETEALFKMLSDERGKVLFGENFQKVNTFMKMALTKVNPGFYSRNLQGDVWINMLDGVTLKDTVTAVKMVSHQSQQYGPELMNSMSKVEQAAAAIPGNQVKGVLGKGYETAVRFQGKPLKRADVWALYNKYGGRSGFFSDTDKIFKPAKTPVGDLLRRADTKINAAHEIREDSTRLAHFISLMRKDKTSKTLEEAASKAMERVRLKHVDYDLFTPFEKKYMATLMPFYKWQRGMLPQMLELMVTKPGAYTAERKIRGGVSELLGFESEAGVGDWIPMPDAIVPSYIEDSGAFPVMNKGQGTLYANWDSPLQKAGLQMSDPFHTAVNMVNPLLKAPFELATGHTTFNGQPTGSVPEYLLKQLPVTGLVPRMQTQDSSIPLVNWATGGNLIDNTAKRQEGEGKRRLARVNKKNKKADPLEQYKEALKKMRG